MGMYTELNVAFSLTADTPQQVTDMLQWMVNQEGSPPPEPDAPLFTTKRWASMLMMDSYYFDGGSRSTVAWDEIGKMWSVTIRCNLKNYDDEISEFLDWLVPHVEVAAPWQYVGTTRYEEDDLPTLVIVHGDPRRIQLIGLCGADVAAHLMNLQT